MGWLWGILVVLIAFVAVLAARAAACKPKEDTYGPREELAVVLFRFSQMNKNE